MRSVLIVDDDPLVCKMLRAVLEKERFEVFSASNGNECLDLLKDRSPTLFLVDIVMPEKDGVSTIKEIKRINQEAKIIAISGGAVFVPETYLDEAKLAGADVTLTKPIDRQDLLTVINEVLDA